jgi:hypothetical protein
MILQQFSNSFHVFIGKWDKAMFWDILPNHEMTGRLLVN